MLFIIINLMKKVNLTVPQVELEVDTIKMQLKPKTAKLI